MGPSTGWAKQQPLLRLGLVSTAGVVVAILCAEAVGVLGSSTAMVLIAPIVTAASLVAVAVFCWFTSSAAQVTAEPPPILRRIRNGLATGLVVLLAVSVAGSFSGDRVGLPTGLQAPLAILVALIAVAFACVAIAFVRREQALFLLAQDAMPDPGIAVTSTRPPLERMRTTHGLMAGGAAMVTLMLFAAGATPYVFPFAGLILVPSVSTWAYAGLRLSRLDRRPLPSPDPKRPPGRFRTARHITIILLAMVPIGVLWWVWLSVNAWGLDGVDLARATSRADVVLWASIVMGLVAAVAYPFFAIPEGLRTPTKEMTEADDGPRDDLEPEPLPEWRIEKARSLRAPEPGLP